MNAGYAQRFERRPEFELWGSLAKEVVDASAIRQRRLDDLKIIQISDVFAGPDEIFIGFGKPNAYLVVPDGKGGYQKFAGKSLKRAPSRIEDTRGFVQSGVLIRFRNLPEGAAEALRIAMQVHNNIKYWTCLNAILRVMAYAGFSSSGRALTSRYMPHSFMHALHKEGLFFNGQRVQFDVVRTTPEPLQRYAAQVSRAEFLTLCRHADRSAAGLAKKNKVAGWFYGLVRAPINYFSSRPAAAVEKAPVAPALPADVEYQGGFDIRVTGASMMVAFLRQFWGPHAFFEGRQQRVDIGAFLTEDMKPFPKPRPDFVTRLKKRLFFSPLVVRGIRYLLASEFISVGERRECDVYDMLRTHCDKRAPNKYNLVLTTESIIVARINVGAKIVDWILAKHVLMSGYHPHVRFAGEIWKDADGVIHVNRNSGTYQPSEAQLQAAVEFLRALFPNLKVVVDEAL